MSAPIDTEAETCSGQPGCSCPLHGAATPAQVRAFAVLALLPTVEGLPPFTLGDVMDPDYARELLDCFRSERAAALVASGWVETHNSRITGICARALSASLVGAGS